MTEYIEAKNSTRYYLWQIVRYKPHLFGGLISAYVVQYCMSMIPVLIARQILDTLSGDAQIQLSLVIAFGLWIISELIRMSIFTVIILFETKYYQQFWSLVRANVFEYLLSHSQLHSLSNSQGELISRFRDDVEQIQTFMSMLYNAVATGAFAFIAFVIMLNISVRMTLFVFLPLVLVTALVQRTRQRIVTYRKRTQEATGQITRELGEMFGAVQAIQAAQAEDRMIERFNNMSATRGKLAMQDSIFSEILLSITRNMTNFGTGIILLLGADAMRLGDFTIGDFVLFMFYLGWVTDFTAFFGQAVTAYRQLGVSLVRLETLIQSEPERLVKHRPVYLDQPLPLLPQPIHVSEPLRMLDVEHLSYQYPNYQRGIDNISFRIGAGEIVAITGRIGAGKSTLLKALLGLLPDGHGTIRWNGNTVTDAASFFIPPHTAYTPQVPHLFSDTLGDNIRMGLEGVNIAAAIHTAVMEADIASMEHGLETHIGMRGMRLSGGQLQRAAAARMFVRSPQLFVIDDLSSALDVDTESILWERLFAQPQVTCLIVSHRPVVLNRADHVIWLEDGQVRGYGPWHEVSKVYS
jgi:ATP-binding cassette, subfamily B, bacterial